MSDIPKLPVGDAVEGIVEWIQQNLGWALDAITDFVSLLIDTTYLFLSMIPPALLMIIIAGLLALPGLRGKNIKKLNQKEIFTVLEIPVMAFLGMLLIWNLELWDSSVQTLALVIVATVISLVIGIPSGILTAKKSEFEKPVKIILDFMQTMPSFVYLIPAVIFFGLGEVPGVIATVIFSMPPAIRLTSLGIKQIPKELSEVADAFGATPLQKLSKVEIPVAMPTIMAGVNQCIMLALSMTVIASMIGAQGLGYLVLYGIQRVDIGTGFEAGLAIVIIAIILDRLTQSIAYSETPAH
ncbi:ABC transporter permease subunit [Methanoplanus sp. FWC-SCC4]|uniref:ABC transporter permease subunit n=1 Tax=Methanochimaera problematica TaxID=2609417 RepID=A0AA97FEV3_9EURY|nr:ABC transporter permease subunit [Methanoplanus sp. FWC-SCC4]WOF16998.1 ABC transporter permease subunit [Methanoplanus sp. FWC-SCC4]